MMQTANNRLIRREDTFFGVCEGLGQDLGVSPTLFRLGFAGFLFWNPTLAIAAYAALGLMVYTLRWVMPDRAVASQGPSDAPVAVAAENDAAPAPVQIAA